MYRGVLAPSKRDVSFSVLHTASVPGWSQAAHLQRQVFYPSHDGTPIPMHLAHKRALDLSRPHPTLFYAYGGFGWAQEPRWDSLFAAFVEKFDGVVAVAGIRGGGEYGNAWHEAGRKGEGRVRAYGDAVEGVRWLKREGVASKVAIHGASNGLSLSLSLIHWCAWRFALIVETRSGRRSAVRGGVQPGAGAHRCGPARVSLFAPRDVACRAHLIALFDSVGVMDLLRFHKVGCSPFIWKTMTDCDSL